jgi:hypothetical protein
VNDASDAGCDHDCAELRGGGHMLDVGFADAVRVFQENLIHLLPLVDTVRCGT